jgi:hypothetical protein
MARRQRNDLVPPTEKEWISADDKCIPALLDKRGESRIYLLFGARF